MHLFIWGKETRKYNNKKAKKIDSLQNINDKEYEI
jgi:hypothetical protein